MKLAEILQHLKALIACDTQNPPRAIDPAHKVFRYISSVLTDAKGFRKTVTDHGRGRVSYLVERGNPKLLFNVHLDTVQVGSGWTRPPLELTVEEGRAFGRGCCDIKGAAAILLAIAEAGDIPLAILFSTDEEGAESCCIDKFANSLPQCKYDVVVVAEPTTGKAVLSHRGYLSVLGEFRGRAGHSSSRRALRDNAVHQAALWASAAIAYAGSEAAGGRDLCFNIGSMHGGIASNVIAATANVHWSARLPPGTDTSLTLGKICDATKSSAEAEWNARFVGLPLPADSGKNEICRELCEQSGVELGSPVDYWTEAALFSAAGLPALVLGPGDIEQAHAADEWVSLDQLAHVAGCYERLIAGAAR